jgi:EAL domain-containing protein (putative c-di-GMP-specific phosphodiesterase class I)/CheY-like chemotaxis protein
MAGKTSPRGRVLIVDDEADLLEVYAAIVESAGHDVVCARTGREALRGFEAGRFDVIVSDICMPDLGGLELLNAVRALDLDVPVVLITGSPRLETAVEAVAQGALQYFVKPVSEAALLDAVARAVRLYRLAVLKREALVHLGSLDALVGDRAGLEVHFESALRSLRMAYQPVVSSADGQLFAHEALVRTGEPAFPHPGSLLAAAERLDRLPDLGRRIRSSIAGTMGNGLPGTVFVNMHPQDFLDETLFEALSPLAHQASRVVLEVTERTALDTVGDVASRVKALRKLGYRIAIDDLGAGYAGLSSFAALEPDVVKLDMSLIRDLDREPVKRRVVGSMAALCRELGVLVVAEGIETESERSAVVTEGCDLLQGYLLGRPLDRSH